MHDFVFARDPVQRFHIRRHSVRVIAKPCHFKLRWPDRFKHRDALIQIDVNDFEHHPIVRDRKGVTAEDSEG